MEQRESEGSQLRKAGETSWWKIESRKKFVEGGLWNEDIHITLLVWRTKAASFGWSVSGLWIIFVCMSWDWRAVCDVSQFAIHLYERCFSATRAIFSVGLAVVFHEDRRRATTEQKIGIYCGTILKWQTTLRHSSWKSLDNFYLFIVSSEAFLCFSIYICMSLCLPSKARKILH